MRFPRIKLRQTTLTSSAFPKRIIRCNLYYSWYSQGSCNDQEKTKCFRTRALSPYGKSDYSVTKKTVTTIQDLRTRTRIKNDKYKKFWYGSLNRFSRQRNRQKVHWIPKRNTNNTESCSYLWTNCTMLCVFKKNASLSVLLVNVAAWASTTLAICYN